MDLLKKSYRVGPYILAGFAGSVQIGLQLISNLQQFLHVRDAPKNAAWQPDWVAQNWHPIAGKIFKSASIDEQASGSQILMVGVSPDENMGATGFARVYVTKLCSPDFKPLHMPRGPSVCHIGSGASVERYRIGISDFFKFGSSAMMAGLQAGPSVWSQMISSNIGRIVSENPVPGISPHVFFDAVALGSFWSGTNDQTTHCPDGRKIEFRMPEVASTPAAFVALCERIGKAARRATG